MKTKASLPKLSRGKKPAYQRLYSAFRDAILKHQLKANEQLPSTRNLAAFYGIARNTVMQAYEQLISEGYLEGRRGAGTFVSAELPERFLKSQRATNSPHTKAGKAFKSRPANFPKHLPLSSGYPDLEHFPREHWIKLYNRQLRTSISSLNWYDHEAGGYAPLREAIATYLNTHRGLVCDPEQILILSGSQPGIELAARALIKSGDRVAVENPSYRGIANAFRLNNAKLVAIPVDEQGMNVVALRRKKRAPQMAVVTPSRHFPLGHAMPVSRRAELLEWAHENRSWILEDDYDSEFRFRGNPLPAMQGMDPEGRTLYLGTFSRSMFPDLRIGYLVAPHRIVPDLHSVWQAAGMNPPLATQATLAEFIRDGSYLRHVRKMRILYSKRCTFLKALIQDKLNDWLEVGTTDGGLHLVAFLKQSIDAEAFASEALQKGISLSPLSRCAIKPIARDGFVLGFSSDTETVARKAVETLRKLFER